MTVTRATDSETAAPHPATVDTTVSVASARLQACDGRPIGSLQSPATSHSQTWTPSRPTRTDRWIARFLLTLINDQPIEIELWDGELFLANDQPGRFRISIHTPSVLRGLLWNPSLAFGDGYSRNEITITGDLAQFCECVELASRQVPRWLDNRAWRWLHWLTPNTRSASKGHIQQHYDLGNDFYKLWLDEEMAYTCAYFSDPSMDLAAAQKAKFDHVARKVRLKPGDRVVDVGCGWGGLALYLAKTYGVSVTAYNISHEQVAYARQRATQESLNDRVVFVEDDWRSIKGSFDAFLSVGMLEHVGIENFRELGSTIHRVLKPQGLGLLHTIGRNIARPVDRWTEKRIFPGSCPPSLRQMMDIFETRDFSILDVENLRLHYARTLELWGDNFEQNAAAVEQMFHGSFVRMWRLYLNASIAAFRSGGLQLFQIVFAHGQNNVIPRTRADLYPESHHA